MKGLIATCAGLIFLFAFAPSISAQDATLTPTQKAGRPSQEQKIQKRQEVKEKIADKRASVEARVKEVRQEHLRFFWTKMKNRLLALITRLERLIERIETRIARIEENKEDINLEKVKADIAAAKAKLTEAEAKISEVDTLLETLLASDSVKESFEELRAKISEVRDILKEVHRLLVSVIGDLRGLRVGQDSATKSAERE